MMDSWEVKDELPVAVAGSDHWCSEEELSLPDTCVSHPLYQGPPAPVPLWLLPPSNSAYKTYEVLQDALLLFLDTVQLQRTWTLLPSSG